MNIRQTVTRLRAAVEPLPVTSGFADVDARLRELSDRDLDRLDVALTRIRELYPRAIRSVLLAVDVGQVPPWSDHDRAFDELAALWSEVSQIWSPGGSPIDWRPSEVGEGLREHGITAWDLARYENAVARRSAS